MLLQINRRPTPTQSTCLYYVHDNEASKCAITNKPDLAQYATNTDLNSLPTNSTFKLSINNFNNASTTISI
jgi:hypothetical protein